MFPKTLSLVVAGLLMFGSATQTQAATNRAWHYYRSHPSYDESVKDAQGAVDHGAFGATAFTIRRGTDGSFQEWLFCY